MTIMEIIRLIISAPCGIAMFWIFVSEPCPTLFTPFAIVAGVWLALIGITYIPELVFSIQDVMADIRAYRRRSRRPSRYGRYAQSTYCRYYRR